MNKVEIIKGIETTIAGLEAIKKAISVGQTPIASGCQCAHVEKDEPKEIPVEETKGSDEVLVGKFDVEQLNSMKYNEFKKFAASLGVKCTGTRAEIMERILALDVIIEDGEAEVVEPVEDTVEEAPVKEEKPKKKLGKKEAEEPAKDEFDEQAEAIAEETSVEDIIEALADVEIKANKKNYVQKLAEALREGLIELDDEDNEEEVDEIDEVEEAVEADGNNTDDDEEIDVESYFPEFDPSGYNNPDEMTEERAEAVKDKMDEILTAYSEGDLTDEEVASYVEDNATEEEIELLGEDYTELDILKLYTELVKRTIDNDGEEHEPSDPYEVGDKDLCCGHELKYVKKTKKYICEQCGSEYETE